MLVRARATSWVLLAADGQKDMEGTLTASAERMLKAHDNVVVKAGNAAAIEIWHNGKLLPPLGGENEVRTVVLNRNGIQAASGN